MLSDLQRLLLDSGEPDLKTAREVLHKLKGSAVTLGAAAVAECCAGVRNNCVAGTLAPLGGPADMPGSLAALRQSLATVQGALGAQGAWRAPESPRLTQPRPQTCSPDTAPSMRDSAPSHNSYTTQS